MNIIVFFFSKYSRCSITYACVVQVHVHKKFYELRMLCEHNILYKVNNINQCLFAIFHRLSHIKKKLRERDESQERHLQAPLCLIKFYDKSVILK